MLLPDRIMELLANETYQMDDIGMSESAILIFQDKVLKIQYHGEEAENEYRMMNWLHGKLPVPQVLAYEIMENRSYLLMSKCKGTMACDKIYMQNSGMQVKLLAEGLQKLWRVDISDCPVDMRLQHKLAMAKYNVEHGLVDLDNVEPATFGKDGFKDPAELLKWLCDHQPKEEPVLSHGDYCLPNVFGTASQLSGFIDLGRTGIADKWCDLALCYRSLSHNYSGRYDGQSYSDFDDMLIFKELEIEPDWEKIRYYILLDELF